MHRWLETQLGEPAAPTRRRLHHFAPRRWAAAAILAACSCAPWLSGARADAPLIGVVTSPATSAHFGGPDLERGVRASLSDRAPNDGTRSDIARAAGAAAFDIANYSDACTAAGARDVAGKLIARGARAVIGHACASAALAVAPIYASRGIVFIATGTRTARLTEPRAGPTIFRLGGRDDRLGADMAAFIAARHAGRTVAIAHDKSALGRALADNVEAALRAAAIVPVLREAYVAGEREYNALAARIAGIGAGLLIVPAQPIEAAIIHRRLRELGSRAVLLGGEAVAVPEIEAVAARTGSDLVVMLPWTPVRVGGRSSKTQLTGHQITGTTAAAGEAAADTPAYLLGYAAGQLLGQAMAHATVAAPATGRAASWPAGLQAEQLDTLIGPIRFAPTGDAALPSFVPHIWREGGWRRIDP